ncbi:MAG: hypothetical protein ACFUZC_16875 [Chthoniobacteraceae bacterium]
MKQIILQTTRKQYDDLLKFLDRRCTIRTEEIADFQNVRAMLRTAKVVDIPDASRKRTVPIKHKSTKPAPSTNQP